MDTQTLMAALPALRARARRISSNPTEADDLLQAALLGALEQMACGRVIDAPVPYLMTALRHANSQARRLRRRECPLADAPEPVTEDASQACHCAEVLAQIDALPPDDRTLLRLVAAGESSPTQLALRLGLPKGTVMSRLSRARSRLRARMGETV